MSLTKKLTLSAEDDHEEGERRRELRHRTVPVVFLGYGYRQVSKEDERLLDDVVCREVEACNVGVALSVALGLLFAHEALHPLEQVHLVLSLMDIAEGLPLLSS